MAATNFLVQNPAYKPLVFFRIFFGFCMKKEKRRTKRGSLSRKTLLTILIIIFVAITLFFVTRFFVSLFIKTNSPSAYTLMESWKNQDYQKVFDDSAILLEKKPLNSEGLMFHGFAAYYISIAQIEVEKSQTFIEEAITSLRNCLEYCDTGLRPRVCYILGKAYYQKGTYYADLACQYLDEAYNSGYQAEDLAEYRGQAYAALGDYETSLTCFTEALAQNPTDLLLFSIAQNYFNIGDTSLCSQYLNQVLETTEDENIEIKARLMLAEIFIMDEQLDTAELEYSNILEKKPECADAIYGLGVIYEQQGDTSASRAQWRKTLRINPAHEKARKKLEQ